MRAFINILNEKLKETRFGLWSYKISGNVVELNVLPKMESEPNDFRLAVVQIGQVLDRLRHEYSHTVEEPQIQVFPNLMEINLVAVIQFTHSKPNRSSMASKNGHSQEKYSVTFSTVKELAKNNHFKLHQTDTDLSELDTHEEVDTDADAYILWAASNNPFIWLKTGYITEQIQRLKSIDPTAGLEINPIHSDKVLSAIKEDVDLTGSPQAILLFKKRSRK